MRSDNVLLYEAIDILLRTFGIVDTERFIALINRDTFDYTEWRRGLRNDMTIDEVYAEAAANDKSN